MSTAAATDEEILNAELQGLFYQDSDYLYSDVAEDYEAWWWEDYVEELDSFPMAAYINMRGFSMSADGRYAYMGTLNGGTGVRGVVVLDTQKGRITDLYYTYNESYALEGSPFSYAKGIAADERGYVYVGFAYSSNYNYVSLGVAKQEENGTLTELCQIPVYQNEYQPGDSIGTKIGVNGVEVAKVGDTFDPTLHEAVMHVEDENLGENTIAEVLQKGYKFGDTVIRPAMVKVAN
jgi:hypothetical protein